VELSDELDLHLSHFAVRCRIRLPLGFGLFASVALNRQTSRMFFRFRGVVLDLGLREEGASTLVFTLPEPVVRVELHGKRGQTAATGTPGATILSNAVEVRCEATMEEEPAPEVRSAFESLAVGQLPAGSLSPETWPRPLAQLAPSGEIQGPLPGVPMSYMPQEFQRFAARIQRELRDAATRAVGLLRWRAAELGAVQPFTAGADVSWDLGDGHERAFPGRTGVVLGPYYAWLELGADAEQDLQRMVVAGQGEPFAYELLREAWALRDSNPRSSLLIAIAALEVGVKQYIADRVRPAKWLVNNLPAPDVIKILSKYLPTLEPPPDAMEGAATFERPSGKLMTLLRNRRDQRNNITHKPEAHQQEDDAATPEDARSAVLGVRQVLLRLEIANGHDWAREYLAEPPYEEPSAGYRRVGDNEPPRTRDG
jgi:hypothetical protein